MAVPLHFRKIARSPPTPAKSPPEIAPIRQQRIGAAVEHKNRANDSQRLISSGSGSSIRALYDARMGDKADDTWPHRPLTRRRYSDGVVPTTCLKAFEK